MTTRHLQGFTIIELMAVMVVVAILATLAAPNLREMIARVRLKTAAGDLHTSLFYARSEAIKRNAGVTIVPVDATDWSKGWSVQIQAGGTVLARQDPYPQIAVSTRNAAYVATSVPSVIFSGSGRETGGGGAGIAFVFTSPQSPTSPARCVVLDPSGRPKVSQDGNGDPSDGC